MTEGVPTFERSGVVQRSIANLDRIWQSAGFRLLLTASTVGLILWVLWGPRLRHAQLYPHFGDLGGWTSGIGSLAAVAVALVQTHRLRVERIDDLYRQEVEQRTQVFGWVAYREESARSGDWWVYLNNMTPAPIRAWVLRIEDPETGHQVTLDVTRLLPILPGFTQHLAGVSPGDLLRPMCQLEFVDAAGVCWRRDVSGRIHQISEIRLGDQILAVSVAPGGGHSGR
jgi:hypothetical protein